MPGTNYYSASRIFTGKNWLEDHAVEVSDGYITDIVPVSKVKDRHVQFTGAMIVPAFIDLQIYGAGGKLFSVYPEVSTLEILREHCENGGTALCLPTVATNSKEVMYRCIDAVRKYMATGGMGIAGIHLEGPWLNPAKRGAHIAEYIHLPSVGEVEAILDHGRDVIRMITLAPEVCSPRIIELINARGILISAGHSNAGYEESRASYLSGVRAVTHLFNAMSQFHHRNPGLPGAAFDDDHVMASIIPDNYHVDFATVRIAKKIMKERLFVITDAVTETGEGPYPHRLEGDKYEAGGILSGSALTMIRALRNLVVHCGIETGEAIRMCSLYPANLLGMDDYGKIEKGSRANLLCLDDELNLIKFLK